MMEKDLILVVEDDPGWQKIIRKALENHDYAVVLADNVEEAKLKLLEHKFSLVTVDLNYKESESTPEQEEGSALLETIKDQYPELPCIVITASDQKGAESARLILRFKDIVRNYLEKNRQISTVLPKEIETILATSGTSDGGVSKKSQSDTKPEITLQKEIFISYAWGGESEKIVDQLDEAFKARGITIVRDKRNLGYKGRIKEFMEQIGRGKCVIVVVSEKYLKSENCMFELVQIAKNGRFYDRIFPIVLADANIYKPTGRISYIKHWEEEIRALNKAMKSVDAANLQGLREDIDLYTEIRRTIAELTNILKDMNTLTPEMHSNSDFTELFNAVEDKMAE